jgi:hypothetical protein
MNENTAPIESLRSFALAQCEGTIRRDHADRPHRAVRAHLVAFAHMCTNALDGEEWAVKRIATVLDLFAIYGLAGVDTDTVAVKIEAILATDVTRPDGAIARAGIEV